MSSEQSQPSRRSFLQGTAATAAAGAIGAALSPRMAHAQGSDTIKVGLIGCGGRGSGAAVNAMNADKNAKLTAMCDIFPDRIEGPRKFLSQKLKDQFDVDDDHVFSDFDGYQKMMQSDVDVVLLATPPHFRPAMLEAAIAAGKHVFCEKPVAVDAPGIRSVLATVKKAKEKNLSIVSGLCWRYDLGVRATVDKILNGEIGEIVAIQENYLTGTLWHRGRKPEWSEMEYQIRNWLYYTWLSGDHNTEQHVHSLDKALWLNNDLPPVKCFGLGGRQVRTEEQWGNIYDHHAVCYEWATGVKAFAYTRQMRGCKNDVEDYVMGTGGSAQVLKHETTTRGGETWKYDGPKPSMYDQEHKEMYEGLRSGNIINNGVYMSYSSMLAIMGRMACYTGGEITWEQAMASQEKLGPEEYSWGDFKANDVAMPGKTKFI